MATIAHPRAWLAVNELLTNPGNCLFTEMDDVESSLHTVLDQLDVR